MSVVSKEDYWVTILNDYSQFGQITTEDSEFNSMANDVWNVLENTFIKIDDEESIIKWEEMTGLSGEGLTIFQRKVNILYTLTVKNYLPVGLFTQAMDKMVGKDNYIIAFDEETQKYEIRCDEDYETSASFLNKRLANERFDLEAYCNKYAECVTVNDMLAVNPDYKNHLIGDGEWIHPLTKLTKGSGAFSGSKALKIWNADLPSLDSSSTWFFYGTSLRVIKPCYIRELAQAMFVDILTLEEVHADTKDVTYGYGVFSRCRNLWYWGGVLSNLHHGEGMFSDTIFDKDSTIRILGSIPQYSSGTHKLTIGIHVDHQTDEDVIAVISAAEAKGWSLTVQWNGTATAATVSTFGLRSPSIYAKLATMERPDGTTENILDWGHYVTNWEENGYQEFSSIEEANEYFNIESETEQ